jgi:hypothetical protein
LAQKLPSVSLHEARGSFGWLVSATIASHVVIAPRQHGAERDTSAPAPETAIKFLGL